MAVQTVPYVETALSHGAELFRRNLQAGLPFGSAGGVVLATPAVSANSTAGVAGCSDLAVSAPASGMTVNVAAGQIFVPGSSGSGSGYGIGTGYGRPIVTLNGGSPPTVASNANALAVQLTSQGAYYCYNDNSAGAVSLAIASSNPTNPRLDVVIAQVEDAAYTGSNNDWKLAVVTGTAAASPTVPALPASCVVLAYVWVPANASSIVAGDILDLRVTSDRNPFRASMYRSAALTQATAVVAFDTITYDITGAISNLGTTSVEYTCPVGGLYVAYSNIVVTPVSGSRYQVLVLKNGSAVPGALASQDTGSTATLNLSGSQPLLCAQGDTLQIQFAPAASIALSVGTSTYASFSLVTSVS